MIQAARDIRMPKTTMIQNSMVAVEQAIQDNIVGITPELAQEHLDYVLDMKNDITTVRYKDKDILRFGIRGVNPEFFIEVKGAVIA
jgi:hypothetical protein